jgi:hypothetical protein
MRGLNAPRAVVHTSLPVTAPSAADERRDRFE